MRVKQKISMKSNIMSKHFRIVQPLNDVSHLQGIHNNKISKKISTHTPKLPKWFSNIFCEQHKESLNSLWFVFFCSQQNIFIKSSKCLQIILLLAKSLKIKLFNEIIKQSKERISFWLQLNRNYKSIKQMIYLWANLSKQQISGSFLYFLAKILRIIQNA